MNHSRNATLLSLIGAALLAAPMAAQIVEEDLPVFDESIGVDEETFANFEDAVSLLRATDRDGAFALFTRVISRLSAERPPMSDAARDMMLRSLAYRARITYEQGNVGLAQGDLERLITIDPDFEIDPQDSSPDLLKAYSDLKSKFVGWVNITVVPRESTLRATRLLTTESQADRLADESFEINGGTEVAMMAGRYLVQARRPGFTGDSVTIEVKPGERSSWQMQLTRLSATVKLYTEPAGATVLVDGIERGATELEPSGKASLWIETLNRGPHEVEIKKDGFRPYRAKLMVRELRDYAFKPIALEREAGVVRLHNYPAGAVAQINGRGVRPRVGSDGSTATLNLAPGSYKLSIAMPDSGVFESDFVLGDKDDVDIDVALRSGLVLLGVLGRDKAARDQLLEELGKAFHEAGYWTLLDRRDSGEQILPDLGLTAERMRKVIGATATDGNQLDWSKVQTLIARSIPGQAYAIIVLDDDLLAREADVWVLAPPPAPFQPDHRTLVLSDPETFRRVAEGFAPSLIRRAPTLGAVIIDSELTPAPVVASLTSGGPAAVAGLELGDEITAFGGVPIFTAKQIQERLSKLPFDQPIELEIRSHRGSATSSRTVTLTPRPSIGALDTSDPTIIDAAASAELQVELGRQQRDTPRWLLELNQALLEMRAQNWDNAVSILRQIEGPKNRGLGQATVDYCLGISLTNAGPRYIDAAREAFSRAAQSTDGRLFSDDGPLVSPRARARLQALGTGR